MARYRIRIDGTAPIIMHNGAAGIDPRLPENLEKKQIASKRAGNRTEEDDLRLRELEVMTSLYVDDNGRPTLPATCFRAMLETSARKMKQGAQVREGLIVEECEFFDYDEDLGTTPEELSKTVQFTVGVVVNRARILRTRARFDQWGAVFVVDGDEELVDKLHLETWLKIGGKRIGLGDWRPEKSGLYGRFETTSIKLIKEDKA